MAKVKSRDEELKEKWLQYFRNIAKENELIRELLKFYKEIEPDIQKISDKEQIERFEDISDEEFDGNFPKAKKESKRVIKKINNSVLPDIVDKIPNNELQYYLNEVKTKLNETKTLVEKEEKSVQNRFKTLSELFSKYEKIIKETHVQTVNLKPNVSKNRFKFLAVDNFKGFATKNTIKIKPITLIYGPNSYGKSSIMQSLLLLNQTINEGKDYNNVNLLPNGTIVSLGAFNDFLNKQNDNNEIKIEISLPDDHYFQNNYDKFLNLASDFYKKREYEKAIEDFDRAIKLSEIGIKLGDKEKMPTSILSELSVCLHFALRNINSNSSHKKRKKTFSDNKNEDKQIILSQIDVYEKQTDYDNPENPVENHQKLICTLKYTENNLYEITDADGNDLGKSEKISFFSVNGSLSDIFRKLEDSLKSIVYVSSYRKQPKRYYVPENNRRIYVGKNGEFTAEILGYDNDVLNDVNHWLDRIAKYKLDVNKDEKVSSVTLDDKKTDVKSVNLLDLGSGVAQVLPVITQAFINPNEDKSKNGTMVLVEEPEIHLHPKAQAEIGEMFAKAAEKTGNTFIIETHSENLLLRLEKLIRKGELSKDDVSVIYVDKSEDGSYCIPLIIDNEGDIENIDEIPDGFFEESFNELFDVDKE